MTPDQIKKYLKSIKDLKEDKVLEQTQVFIENGEDPLQIISECEKGMVLVGQLYEKGVYFISSLIVAGEIFRQVGNMVQPLIKGKKEDYSRGSILLGTVQGDIHDLGKNLFGLLMKCHGFTVHDIGVDISPEEFCQKAIELRPDIIGLSGLLTIAYDSMEETIAALKHHSNRDIAQTPVIIRAAAHISNINETIGTDYYAYSAMSGVNICKQIMSGLQTKK